MGLGFGGFRVQGNLVILVVVNLLILVFSIFLLMTKSCFFVLWNFYTVSVKKIRPKYRI